jgi:hypothetical protein
MQHIFLGVILLSTVAVGLGCKNEATRGDPGFTAVIRAAKLPFGIFSHIHEAGGRATGRTGRVWLEQGKKYDTLFLNPGPADGVRWGMNDGSASVGMAAVMAIGRGAASYEVLRVPADAVAAVSVEPAE